MPARACQKNSPKPSASAWPAGWIKSAIAAAASPTRPTSPRAQRRPDIDKAEIRLMISPCYSSNSTSPSLLAVRPYCALRRETVAGRAGGFSTATVMKQSQFSEKSIARFWAKVDKNGPIHPHKPELGPCWVWTGCKTTSGFGMVVIDKKDLSAHRVSFLIHNGSIPSESVCVGQSCDKKLCVNPAHLFLTAHRIKVAGGVKNPTYKIWVGIKTRCLNPRYSGWKNYGGRGIKICDRWKDSFENFFADMGPRPEGMSIERKESNGDYEPDNCIWATTFEQSRNKRNNRLITIGTETKIFSDWCRFAGITFNNAAQRESSWWWWF